MTQWPKRIRGALGTGLIWALFWAPVAIVVGTRLIDPDDSMDEMWFMVGALPGFLSGVVFSSLVSSLARHRKLRELSILRVGGWGAIAGAATGVLPFILGDTGGRPWIGLAAGVISTFALLSAISAAGSLALAQRAERRELPDGKTGVLSSSRMDLRAGGAPTPATTREHTATATPDRIIAATPDRIITATPDRTVPTTSDRTITTTRDRNIT